MSRKNVGKPLKRKANFTLHLKMKTGKQKTKQQPNEIYDNLADANSLAIVIVDEHSSAVSESNNNSMCRILYNSDEFTPECEKFCGRAFDMATQTGEIAGYKCYAGLNCLAVPIKKDKEQLVAIVGRAFLKAEDYRVATERAITGDWKQFAPPEFFENALMSNSIENLEKLARKIQRSAVSIQHSEVGTQTSDVETKDSKEQSKTTEEEVNPPSAIRYPQSNWRSLFGSMLGLNYTQACLSILQFISEQYGFANLLWLELDENKLETAFATGSLKNRSVQLSISADDERLLDAAKRETPLELRERRTENKIVELQTIWLFPIAVGEEIRSALAIGGKIEDENKKRHIMRFCRTLASDLEILRLRELLSRRGWLERAVGKFNENLKNIDAEDFWSRLTNISAELMRAERSSLLIFDEKTDAFTAKAATGIKADFIKKAKENLGERVAKNVLNDGEAIVVADVNKIGLTAAPEDWMYKSDSFISYPISIGNRKIGVLNLTDKSDGDSYNDVDLELLDAIMPSLAVMIDRADLKHKAGEFEQLSVTDALTGLLNRRYLEERLTEEIKRSNRHGFPMSFVMVDVDNFKSYNDNFGHTEGDKALQIVGICLKETLRGADVAARYGGEEFSILLPQTNSSEAATIAERIRERVESASFPNRQVTISLGIASCSLSLNSARDLISAADKALYEAKRHGRNNVQIYENL